LLLLSKPRKQGLGKKLLQYATKMSEELGCGGRIFLGADPQFIPNEVPHIFYRKFGMNTESENVNNKLDKFIKEGKQATIKDFHKIKMYYPPVQAFPDSEVQPKKSFWNCIKGFFQNLIG